MGYNLYIGNATPSICMEERSASIVVEGEISEDAPINSTDDKSNGIFPSYSVWSDFTREVGLYEVFYSGGRGWDGPDSYARNENGEQYEGLLMNHPGCQELTEWHYQQFVKARDKHKDASEYVAKRLEWLVWWTRWALDKCQWPSFYNS